MLSTAAISLCACFSSLVSGVDNVFTFDDLLIAIAITIHAALSSPL